MGNKGLHIIADLFGCSFNKLNDKELLLQLFEDAARLSGAKILDSFAHSFHPFGVTLVVVVTTSHLSLHSWPEHGTCSIDLFTCEGDELPRAAFSLIKEVLAPKKFNVKEIPRKLGNRTTPAGGEWKISEIDILVKNFPNKENIARLLPNRSRRAIEKKAKQLGLLDEVVREPNWTTEEIQLLKDNAPQCYLSELSLLLGRSIADINAKLLSEAISIGHQH